MAILTSGKVGSFWRSRRRRKFIRQYLIPWFAPRLSGRLRTFSARSLSEVELKFDDFNSLFVFLHLSPAYKNKAWVILDGGQAEAGVVKKLQETYGRSGWRADQFLQFTQHDFESYYPKGFATEIADALGEKNVEAKRAKKKALLDNIEQWIAKNEEAAKKEFALSAAEVIQRLQAIAKVIS